MMRATLISYMLIILLFLSQSTLLIPVRRIVDADYQSDSDYLGKMPSRPNDKLKPKSKKQRGERRSYEEKLRIDRERKRQLYLQNPEYHKIKNRKTYLKRKSDPVKMANDAERRKIYKAENREKIALRERQYYWVRKAKKEQERMKNEGSLEIQNKPDLQKKRKSFRDGNESIMSSKKQKSPSMKTSTEATHTSTRRPIIARLKLSSDTINTFYGKQSSPPS